MKILIWRTGYLGDMICAVPAFNRVKRQYPDAEIVLLTNKGMPGGISPKAVLEGVSSLDRIIEYSQEDLSGFGGLIDWAKGISRERYDMMIVLPQRQDGLRKWVKYTLLRSFLNIPKVIGLERSNFIKQKTEVESREVERVLSVLSPLGINNGEVSFDLKATDDDVSYVNDLLGEFAGAGEAVVALHPASKFPVNNQWGIKNFIEVMVFLSEKYSVRFVLIGGGKEKRVGDEIMESIKTSGLNVLNLMGECSFTQSAEVLRRSRFLLTYDSGPAHLSAAVGTPVVGIYTSRNKKEAWFPFGQNNTILREEIECEGCELEDCQEKGAACIKRIEPHQVEVACSRYLKGCEKE